MSYDPQTNALYATAWVSPSAGIQGHTDWVHGKTYTSVACHRQSSARTSTARSPPWMPRPTRSCGRSRTTTPRGQGSGFLTTAGGIAFHGNSDGFFQAYDAQNGNLLWQWQTGAGADAPAMTYIDRRRRSTSDRRGRHDCQRRWLAAQRHAVDVRAERQPASCSRCRTRRSYPVIVTGFTGAITQGVTPPRQTR